MEQVKSSMMQQYQQYARMAAKTVIRRDSEQDTDVSEEESSTEDE